MNRSKTNPSGIDINDPEFEKNVARRYPAPDYSGFDEISDLGRISESDRRAQIAELDRQFRLIMTYATPDSVKEWADLTNRDLRERYSLAQTIIVKRLSDLAYVAFLLENTEHRQQDIEALHTSEVNPGIPQNPDVTTPPDESVPKGIETAFPHSPDFRSIRFNGRRIETTSAQAIAISILWEAYKLGTPEMSQTEILNQMGCKFGSKLRDTFRKDGLWRTLVISGKRKGTVRLNLPDPTDPPDSAS